MGTSYPNHKTACTKGQCYVAHEFVSVILFTVLLSYCLAIQPIAAVLACIEQLGVCVCPARRCAVYLAPLSMRHCHAASCFCACCHAAACSLCFLPLMRFHIMKLALEVALQERYFATHSDAVVQNTIPEPMLKQEAVGGHMLSLCLLFTFCLPSLSLVKKHFVNWVTKSKTARGSKVPNVLQPPLHQSLSVPQFLNFDITLFDVIACKISKNLKCMAVDII